MFEDLANRLAERRKRTARFRRVALHVHSPDSFDWGSGGDEKLNDPSLFEGDDGVRSYLKHAAPHFELISITDHMRCGFGCDCSSLQTSDDLTVLPGMEVNFMPGGALGYVRIHVLLLMPEGSSREDFAAIFEGQDFPKDDASRNQTHEVSGVELSDWVTRVSAAGGLCIAAHVDNDRGVRRHFRRTAEDTLRICAEDDDSDLEAENGVGESLKKYLIESGVHAVEVRSSKDGSHYRWKYRDDGPVHRIATLLQFDSHCVEKLARPERATHIKMTDVGIRGLREALQFPDTRIRFPDQVLSSPSPRLLGVEVTGGPESFFGEATVALAENLTCLIGARGAGKSTLVEALRYGFGQNRRLGDLEKRLAVSIRDQQEANLAGSTIRIMYQSQEHGDCVLEASYDPKEDYVTKVYKADGEFLPIDDLEVGGNFPIRLFGWSEVESLGQDPARQRELLDRLVPELEEPLAERKQLRADLAANRASIEQAVAELTSIFGENDGEIRRYVEFKNDYESFNTDEVKALFSRSDLIQAKLRLLESVGANVSQRQIELGRSEEIAFADGVDELLVGNQELADWWATEEQSQLRLIEAEESVRGSIAEARRKLDTFRKLIDSHKARLEDQLTTVAAEIAASVAGEASLKSLAERRQNAGNRLSRVVSIRDRYREKYTELQEHLSNRTETAKSLTACQQRIAGIRSEKAKLMEQRLNAFFPADVKMRVSIDFGAGADREQMDRPLHGLFGARGNSAKRTSRILKECCTPVECADLLLGLQAKKLVGRGGEDSFNEEDANLCTTKANAFSTDTGADITVLSDDGALLSKLLELHEVPWDDREAILLNGGPLNEKSPGQRSSAMLPLIALTENAPLVIDQPEDNLDKRLIGNVLVGILAELKEKRQIIVCTHDPNILVGGDAEQVVVMEAVSDRRGKVSRHGSIDRDEIVKTVIDLLEGGAEAFENRRKRYEDDLKTRGRLG